jgi:prepilin-type N-terminal cleavage/methylation domain-containing protein
MQLTCIRQSRRGLGCAGFSLVEMLVATAIGLVGVATFLSFNRFQLFALQDQTKQIDLQTSARSMLDLFAREVRRAGMDPKCVGTFSGIAAANSYQIQIKADLDSSGAIDGVNEDVTYRFNYDNRSVERVTSASVESLVSGVDFAGSGISYFDGSGVGLPSSGLSSAQRDSVRRVRIELRLTGEAADPNKADELRAFASTNVDLRNRFFIAATACGSS